MGDSCRFCGTDQAFKELSSENLIALQGMVAHPGWQEYLRFARLIAHEISIDAIFAPAEEREIANAKAQAALERVRFEEDLQRYIADRDPQAGPVSMERIRDATG